MRTPRLNFEKLGPWIALIVLVIVSALTSEHFLKPQNLLNILRQVSYTGIIA
jgi:ribose transport system permease protein